MLEIRIHGRGGQGAVIASEILAEAFFKEGKFVQTFPEFGVERRGAPVAAFLRVNDKKINLRCKVYSPHHLIVLDQILLESVNVTDGLEKGGWILINSSKPPDRFSKFSDYKVATVDASKIAIARKLGPRTSPIVNTAILGAFARITNLVKLSDIEGGMGEYVPVNLEGNIQAAREAFDLVLFHAEKKEKQQKVLSK